ncbi:MAG: hypothetical protein ACRCZS_01865 [Chroococcidiopsis sp.]
MFSTRLWFSVFMFMSSISDTSGFTMPTTSAYLANPPVAPGENTQLPTQAATVIKDWATSRTFTPVEWEGVVYTPQGQQPLSVREKAAFEWQFKDQMNWYNNEFAYHKLGTESGLPKITMACKSTIRYFVGTLEKIKDQASFSAGACAASANVLTNLRTVAGDSTAINPPNHPFNMIFTYVRDGIDAINTTPITHYADLAAAEAVGNIRYGTYIYIESTKEVWYRTYKNYWAKFVDRTDASLWLNKGIQAANYDAAVALGPLAPGTVINVGGNGIYVNDTGNTATFSFEWFCRESRSFCFIACAGTNAHSSMQPQYLKTTCMKQLHEVGHVLGLGHGITKGTFASPMSGSPEAYPAEGAHHSFAQALMCYVHRTCLGVSNVAADYNTPSWSWSNVTISPANDGSKYPVLTGTVTSSNQATVPLLGVFVQFAVDLHVAKFNGYVANCLVASRVRPDGTFSVVLDHAYATGDFVLDSVVDSFDGYIQVVNVAGLVNGFNLTRIPLEQRKWTIT